MTAPTRAGTETPRANAAFGTVVERFGVLYVAPEVEALALVARDLERDLHAARAKAVEAITHMQTVLNTREKEAAAALTKNTAADNYTNPEPDIRRWQHAMVAASDAERDARAWLSSTERPAK